MLTRRSFLRQTAALSAGTSLLPATLLAAPKAGRWQIGCYTRPWDKFDLATALDGIAAAGFEYAGLMTANIPQWVLVRTDTAEKTCRNYLKQAQQRGLKILSIYGDGFSVKSSIEEGIRGLQTLIRHCAVCECPNLLLGGTSNKDLVEPYYQAVGECCDFAASHGVALSIKPHGGENATGPQCRQIIEKVGHPNFRLWYDPGNIYYYSDGRLDPVEDSRTVDGLVTGMSVKDYLPPKNVLLTPGTGRVHFRQVMQNLIRGGFQNGPLVVECLKPGTAAEITREAKQTRQFLENLVKI